MGILLSASDALAGKYQCRIATQESIEVTHSVRIVPDTERHDGEPGAVQWSICPLQFAQPCCSLCCIYFLLFVVDPKNSKHAKNIFINNPTFYESPFVFVFT